MMVRAFIDFLEEEEEDLFFDSRDDLSSVASSSPGSPLRNGPSPEQVLVSEVWIKEPGSVRDRRDKFMRLMGLDRMNSHSRESDIGDGELKVDEEIQLDINRMMSHSGAVLRSSGSGNTYSMSSWFSEDTSTSNDEVFEENFMCRIKNLDDGTVFLVDELGTDGSLRSLLEVGSDRKVTFEEFERSFGLSSLVQQFMRRDDNASNNPNKSVRTNSDKSARSTRIRWLKKLGAAACIVDRQGEESHSSLSDSNTSNSGIVKVRSYKKQSKELSAVYEGQNIKAHDGAILTMKFSPDGQYLATGGEDGIVRMWHVMECERTEENSIPEDDPSCIYFTVNDNSELVPLHANNEKKVKSKGLRRTSDPACVVIPPKVFRLSEEPIHEFHGHEGDVLALSWSKSKYLLSASMDKTVRLWKVGSQVCQKVFPHRNFVTCVEFNPIDDSTFISGSIDGKVRIWEIPGCHVVNWIDIREIVTAVCYRPDGKGAVVGTLTGNCRFYDASDNELRIDAQIFVQRKKKSPSKRITSFQFCPSDPRRLMVTSADLKIRILDGVHVLSKFKGSRSSGSQISASFTADGQHIISASEDSNVHVWRHANQDLPTTNHVKSTWSCERFVSSNASLAIPWPGFRSRDPVSTTSNLFLSQSDVSNTNHMEDSLGQSTLYMSPSGSFALSHEFFSEFLPKGSATWPEEKLPSSSSSSALCKSHYKFLKTFCQDTPHAWGQVIVTAGCDGWIRSYQNYGLPLHL